MEVQYLEGQGAEVEGLRGQGLQVEGLEGEVGSSEGIPGKVLSFCSRKDQWCFRATCGTLLPQSLDQFNQVDGGILRVADDGTSQEEEDAGSQDSQEEDDLELELNL